jgi:very-short-patch-repair endonuclease
MFSRWISFVARLPSWVVSRGKISKGVNRNCCSGTRLDFRATASHPWLVSKSTRLGKLLRRNETWAEKLMWSWLRDRRFSAYKFRRQVQVKGFYLDFYCPQARVNIELDGSRHGFPMERDADARRDVTLESEHIKVLRFWNHQLRTEKDVVREKIWSVLQERVPRWIPSRYNQSSAGDV